jgi:hypothetical protein
MIQLVQPIDEKYAFWVERGKVIGSAVLLDKRGYTAYTTSQAGGDMGAMAFLHMIVWGPVRWRMFWTDGHSMWSPRKP